MSHSGVAVSARDIEQGTGDRGQGPGGNVGYKYKHGGADSPKNNYMNNSTCLPEAYLQL